MKELKVKLTFLESALGTTPMSKELLAEWIASNAPDAMKMEEEIEAIGEEAVFEKGMTGFPRTDDGHPFFWDYQIKGFFKDACGMLSRVTGTESKALKAYKKVIDGLIFVKERRIPIALSGEMDICQRPLRAQTAQGERIALAASEQIPAGSSIEFTVQMLADHEKVVREWLDYGALRGLSQWRNSGKGRFAWVEVK